jgi:hypothetical protein
MWARYDGLCCAACALVLSLLVDGKASVAWSLLEAAVQLCHPDSASPAVEPSSSDSCPLSPCDATAIAVTSCVDRCPRRRHCQCHWLLPSPSRRARVCPRVLYARCSHRFALPMPTPASTHSTQCALAHRFHSPSSPKVANTSLSCAAAGVVARLHSSARPSAASAGTPRPSCTRRGCSTS